jgi:hypothetical protein
MENEKKIKMLTIEKDKWFNEIARQNEILGALLVHNDPDKIIKARLAKKKAISNYKKVVHQLNLLHKQTPILSNKHFPKIMKTGEVKHYLGGYK